MVVNGHRETLPFRIGADVIQQGPFGKKQAQ